MEAAAAVDLHSSPGLPCVKSDTPQPGVAQLTQLVGKHVTDTAGVVSTLQVLGALMDHFNAKVTEADWAQADSRDISMLRLLLQLPSLLLSAAFSFFHDGALAAAAVSCARQAYNAAFSVTRRLVVQARARAVGGPGEWPPAQTPDVAILPTHLVVPPVVQLLQQVLQLDCDSTKTQQQQQPQDQERTSSDAAVAATAHGELWTVTQKQQVVFMLMDILQAELSTYAPQDWAALSQRLAVAMEVYARTALAPVIAAAAGSPAAEAARKAMSAMQKWQGGDFTADWQLSLAQCLCRATGAPLVHAAAAAGEAEQQLLLSLLLTATKFYQLPVPQTRLNSLPLERGDLLTAAAMMADRLSRSHSSSSSNSGQLPAPAVPWVALAARAVIAYCHLAVSDMAHDIRECFTDEHAHCEDDWLDFWTDTLSGHLHGLRNAARALNHMCLGQLSDAAAVTRDSNWGTTKGTCVTSEQAPAADVTADAAAVEVVHQAAMGVSLCELLPSHVHLQEVLAALECAEKLGGFACQLWGEPAQAWQYSISSQGSMIREEAATLANLLAAGSGKARVQVIKDSFIWQLPGRLAAVAAEVAAQLPIRHCCNNPACSNLSGLSELQLVGGKSCICAGCKTARYCSAACQRAHWAKHKPVCKRIRSAAAAAAEVDLRSVAAQLSGTVSAAQ